MLSRLVYDVGIRSICGGLFFFQAEDGIRDLVRSRGLGDVYKRQQQDPRRPAVRRVQILLPAQRGGVLRQLLRLLPALSLIHI